MNLKQLLGMWKELYLSLGLQTRLRLLWAGWSWQWGRLEATTGTEEAAETALRVGVGG